MTMTICPTTLKSLRKARKLGRPKLAKMSGLTERQVARLEGAAPDRGVDADSVARLAVALHVAPGVLTGAEAVTDLDLATPAKPSCGCC